MKRRVKIVTTVTVIAVSLCCAIAAILFGDAAVEKLLIESHERIMGEFHGFNIGVSKEEAFAQIKLSNPKAWIVPTPDRDFVVTGKNLDQLRLAYKFPGLQIHNYRGISIQLFFEDDRISSLDKSVPAANLSWFRVSDTRHQAIEQIAKLLRDDPSLEILPIVPRPAGGAFALEHLSAEGKTALFSYDSWEFGVHDYKPVGATFNLYFTAGRLAKIAFRRPRIELP